MKTKQKTNPNKFKDKKVVWVPIETHKILNSIKFYENKKSLTDVVTYLALRYQNGHEKATADDR